MTWHRFTLLLLAAFLVTAPAVLAGDEETADDVLARMTFDHYYDGEALQTALGQLHAAFPDRTRLESMGKSREGRPLHVFTVFDPTSGDPDEKPAFYVDGNTHGNEAQCAEVCLFTIHYLLRKRADPWVTDLLQHVTFHVAPSVNPDSRHRFFHTAQTPHSPRAVLRPIDDDRDGRVDEDGPNDLDGDGHILRMRIRDENGSHVVDERDARLMRARKPGEKGMYRLLGSEGVDDDDDGRLNEDPEGGVDPNRNWPAQWQPAPKQSGSGPYPLSEPETRATALWILEHPRIAGVQSYHNSGRMILRPSGAFQDRDLPMPAGDLRLYDEIVRRGLHVLPTYEPKSVRKLYQVFGSFVEWAYVDLGVFSFTNELWGDVGREVPGADDDPRLAALRWNDVALHGQGFVNWHEVEHPRYGTVEVGGWRRFTVRNTPPDFLYETCVRNCLFTLEHAAMLPRIRVEPLAPASDGAHRVRVTNEGVLPTIHEMARRFDRLPPDRLHLDGGKIHAAARERFGKPADLLEVKGGAVHLPQGIDGESSFVIRVWATGEPQGARIESRLGGVVQERRP